MLQEHKHDSGSGDGHAHSHAHGEAVAAGLAAAGGSSDEDDERNDNLVNIGMPMRQHTRVWRRVSGFDQARFALAFQRSSV